LDYFSLNAQQRTNIEKDILMREAKSVYEKLPKSDHMRQSIFENCIENAHGLEWNTIAKNIII
ncbi:MAG TPA: hypothetical protein PLH63_08160, partial [Candidatus Cloacimonadota bacterium]|nr:hypothetical protein [Candidatus Cloacimonadota bacterium]